MQKGILIFSIIAIAAILISGTVDLNNLFNYETQTIPSYITKDNTTTNYLTNEGATLGRVLFYDKNLSIDNTNSCAFCHKQELAFGDAPQASFGVDGTTGRHSMRLVNAGFSNETHFFWDERANTLEDQVTMPIKDHVEMGFSGANGDPDMDSLLVKLGNLDYYQTLFSFQYGDPQITEERMQFALAQFIRSIQSFDSKFDAGLAQTNNINLPFPNFTTVENNGKNLFLAPPQFDNAGHRIGGGAGCAGCHQGPEFDIDSIVGNNGVIGAIGGGIDLTNTRAPSLRDVFDSLGYLNGPLMHSGNFLSMQQVLNHYDSIPPQPANNNLDPRLRPGGNLQRLHLTIQESNSIITFLKTLSGSNIYVDEKWSDPFDVNGNINIIDLTTSIQSLTSNLNLSIYPNPSTNQIIISGTKGDFDILIYNVNGRLVNTQFYTGNSLTINVENLPKGMYLLSAKGGESNQSQVLRFVKQ